MPIRSFIGFSCVLLSVGTHRLESGDTVHYRTMGIGWTSDQLGQREVKTSVSNTLINISLLFIHRTISPAVMQGKKMDIKSNCLLTSHMPTYPLNQCLPRRLPSLSRRAWPKQTGDGW